MASLKDIAQIAGVGVSTVSKALSGHSDVGPDTAKRIIQIAKEIGYQPVRYKPALAGAPTQLIGLIAPEIQSAYYAPIAASLAKVLEQEGYRLLYTFTNFDTSMEIELLHILLGCHVDAIALISLHSKELYQALGRLPQRTPIPIVQITDNNRGFPLSMHSASDAYDSVTIDEASGVDLLISHLAKLGHKRIGMISEEQARTARSGFYQALTRNGLVYDPRLVRIGKERFEKGGYLRMKELLSTESPTAVLAGYDNFAIGALRAAKEMGYDVPRDLSIVSHNGILTAPYLERSLTSVVTPLERLGELAGQKLLHALSSGTTSHTVEHIFLKPTLIIRETTAPPKGID